MKDFKKCCISKAMDETYDDMLWNGSEEDGNVRSGMKVRRMGILGVNVRKMKAMIVKMDTVTLIGKSRQYMTWFVC